MTRNALMFFLVSAFVVATSPQAGADGTEGPLEGTWSVVAVTMNGVKATDRIAGKLKVTVRGNKMMLKPGLAVDGNGKVEPGNAEGEEAAFTLDSKKSPAHINLKFGSGTNSRVFEGIYLVEKDELKICFSSQSRPADFANAAGSSQTLLVAKRDKP